MPRLFLTVSAAALTGLAACSTESPPVEEGYGPNPTLPEPDQPFLIPTMRTAEAVGWQPDQAPAPAPGLAVTRFADGLEHPRWLYVLPNGDVLLAEAASRPTKPKGIRGWVQQRVMKHAGAVEESPDRIMLLRDADGDGTAEFRDIFLAGLNQPHGMVLHEGYLYVGATDALLRVPYSEGDTRAQGPVETVTDLPFNPENNGHWPRNVVVGPDGVMYVAVGSVSNVGEAGMAVEENRAAIHTVNPATGAMEEFASGLRNPNGIDFTPDGTLWTVVNERDELGDNLVPDYLTSVREGAFYGWPWVYFGDHPDPRFDEDERPEGVIERSVAPDYALGAHTASLGLVFYDGDLMPQFSGGAIIGQHGSWNRGEPSGYQVIHVPFANGQPSGMPQPILTGFLDAEQDHAMGRPVGVAVAADGAILVADDVGEAVWRIVPDGWTPAPAPAAAAPATAPRQDIGPAAPAPDGVEDLSPDVGADDAAPPESPAPDAAPQQE